MKKTILLIEDDPKVEARITEILGEYSLDTVKKPQAALEYLHKKNPDLMILDHDLTGIDGLQAFRQVHSAFPQIKTILLSHSNDIPLAVTATKLGAADFLKKPLAAEQLRLAVSENISSSEKVFFRPTGIPWQGESARLKKMYADIRQALISGGNLLLYGERGIDKGALVEYIHAEGRQNRKNLKAIDLSAFRRENFESHFWSAVQEISSPSGTTALEEQCGTLYLENIEKLDENFRASVIDYFKSQKGSLLTVIGVYEKAAVDLPAAKSYFQLELPAIRERKEDLPQLLAGYLKKFALKHGKTIEGFAGGLLQFLMFYDYPGNYRELECLLEEAVLASNSTVLNLPDIPLELHGIISAAVKKALQTGKLNLAEANKIFEGDFYKLLLSKTGQDFAAVARFLDMPRTALVGRADNLGVNFLD